LKTTLNFSRTPGSSLKKGAKVEPLGAESSSNFQNFRSTNLGFFTVNYSENGRFEAKCSL
jgi:hypothetical protein